MVLSVNQEEGILRGISHTAYTHTQSFLASDWRLGGGGVRGVGKPTPLCDASDAKLFWLWREQHDRRSSHPGLTLGHQWLSLVLRSGCFVLCDVVGLNTNLICFPGCKLWSWRQLNTSCVQSSDHLFQQVLVWVGSH